MKLFSITPATVARCIAARASTFIEYSLGRNSQAQALFASYGADVEFSGGGDDDKKNWLLVQTLT